MARRFWRGQPWTPSAGGNSSRTASMASQPWRKRQLRSSSSADFPACALIPFLSLTSLNDSSPPGQPSDPLFAEGVEDHDPAGGEAEDGAEGGNQQTAGVEMDHIAEDGGKSENQAEDIEPQRRANGSAQVVAQAQLEQ